MDALKNVNKILIFLILYERIMANFSKKSKKSPKLRFAYLGFYKIIYKIRILILKYRIIALY